MPNKKPNQSLLYVNDKPATYPPSYYAASANSFQEQTELRGEQTFDVAIVGAGFTGLSAAIDLAKRGYTVCVVEAHRVGFGASGRNGGQVGTGQRLDQDELEDLVGHEIAQKAWIIAEQAKQRVKDLISEYGIQCDLKPGIINANHRARFDRHSQKYAEMLRDQYRYSDIRFVPPAEMSEMVGCKKYSGGTLDMGSAHLHPLNYTLGLASAALKLGVKIFERSEVLSVTHTEPVVLTTAKGKLRAGSLIYACNGYLGNLDRDIARRVMPINNYILATEPLDESVARQLIRDDVAVEDSRFVVNYFRLSPDRRLLFGGGESYGYRFPADIKSFVRKRMLDIYPQLANVRIDYGWGGTLAITMSRLPHFQRLAGNVLSASGYSGSGVAMATGAGAILAEAIDAVNTRFDVMNELPTPVFPGGVAMRHPILILAMAWYAMRDRL
ncbi:MAG: gamma-glutamylputrescine oxidase [Parasphingorhabdus sp.]|jgi:gamma-glutamylputrescine oxidase